MKSLLLNIFGASSLLGFVKEYKWGAIVFSLIIIWPTVGFLPSPPQIVMYIAFGIIALWSLMNYERCCIPILLLLTYLPVEILISSAPSFFSPWSRYLLFALVLMSASSLFESGNLILFRKRLFTLLLIWCVLLGAGSFIARFMGINYMKTFWTTDISVAGIFGGLTNHSMLLGPIAGLGTIYMTYKYIISKNYILLILAIMGLGSVIFTASRSALIATVTGIVVLLFFLNRTPNKILKYLFVFFMVGMISFPYWSDALEKGFVAKNGGSMSELSTSSRDSKWNNRIEEFESSPLFGVGFSTVNMENIHDYSYDGGVETGSSWLSVLSMTGIVGAALMLLILIKAILRIYRQRDSEGALIIGILSMFIVSMIAEGYIFGGGNFLCIMFWLTLGRAYDYNSIPSI